MSRCNACDAPVPPGVDLCPNCRTERLPIADLGMPGAWDGGGDGDGDGDTLVDEGEGGALSGPLCGRDDVLQRLAGLATQAALTQQVRFCLVTGAPGGGKSRLLRELGRALRVRSNPTLRVFCGTAGDEGAPPYAAFAEQVRQRFDIDPRELAQGARDKLLRGCKALLPGLRATEVAHLLGEMLRLPFPDSPVTDLRTAQRRMEPRFYLAVKRLIAADASRGPIALLFDEMEHASQEAVNLLHYLAEGLSGVPVFLCAFARPDIDETHPNFGNQGEVSCERIELPPLTARDSVSLLSAVAGKAGEVPGKVVRHVERHLSGSPRAILELLRLFIDTDILVLHGTEPGWDLPRLQHEILPVNLEELVLARLAAMDPAQRELLERAATCGEHFWVDAVVALIRCGEVGLGMSAEEAADAVAARGPIDPDGPTLEEIVVAGDRATHEVTETLRQLTTLGFVVPLSHSTISGESEYRFAYPPLRDVVYDAMQSGRRRLYHGQLSQWLELTPDGRREEALEVTGRHLERAGKGDAAAWRYRRAADAARERYAHGKATRLYARAIACLGTVDLSLRINLWHELGTVFHLKGDYDNALSAYEKVVRLSWVVASRSKAALALLHMGQIWRQKGEPQLALDYLSRALELFEQAEDPNGVADTLDDIGQVLWLLGRYEDALDRSATALETRRRQGDRAKVATSLLNIGNIERHRGLFEAAESCYGEALGLARTDGDKLGIAACLNAIGMLSYQRGDQAVARRNWEEALALVEEVGAAPLQVGLLCHLGEVLLLQGSLKEAQAHMERARLLAQQLSDKRLMSESTRYLGLIALRQGDTREALSRCQAALSLAEAAGVRVDVGRALVALGEVHAATLFDAGSEEEPPARDYFRRAVALFREIGNDAELAQGLYRQGRYDIECGEIEDGRELLAEAEGIFARLKMKAAEDLRQMLSEL